MRLPAARRAAALVAVALATACARSTPGAHTVEIRGFTYVPATLEVAVGDTVVWVNRDIVPHTATQDGRAWDSGSLGTALAWRVVAASPGRQLYYCTFHPTMRGVLVVR
jgi:plastocyanin